MRGDIEGHVINIPEGYHLDILYHITHDAAWRRDMDYVKGSLDLGAGIGVGEIYGSKIDGIRGPAVLTLQNPNTRLRALEYEIVSNDLSSVSEVKYTSSLSSDGNRLAIAQQDGTNSFTRVFEYDGSSWNQLGADVQ